MEPDNESQDWLRSAKAPLPGKEIEGIVLAIRRPREVKTKFGQRKVIGIEVKTEEGIIIVEEYLPRLFPTLSLKTNLGKVLIKYGCTDLSDLRTKKIQLFTDEFGLWKIKRE